MLLKPLRENLKWTWTAFKSILNTVRNCDYKIRPLSSSKSYKKLMIICWNVGVVSQFVTEVKGLTVLHHEV